MRYFPRQYHLLLVFIFGSSTLLGQIQPDQVFKKTRGAWISPVVKILSVDTQCFRRTCSLINNLFLTVKSDSGANARFVQGGQVMLVTHIGDLLAIIVRHGNYYLTYCGVTTTTIKKDDIVHQGQFIGPIGEIGDFVYGLEIVLRKNRQTQKRLHLWFNKEFQSHL